MKKSLIALAVLGTVASAAQAASSVTLYGRVEVQYGDKSSALDSGKSLTQQSAGGVRIGLKGSEDLGNGLAATFQLEGRFDGDTGAKPVNRSFFDRESTVGLKGAFGHVRFGRSYSALENGLPFTGNSRGVSSFDSYSSHSKGRHSNAMLYSYSANGLTVGGDITTKGGFDDGQNATATTAATSNDGTSGLKSAYGLYAKYSAKGFTVGAAFQQDNNPTEAKNEWGVGVSYKYNPVEFGINYSRAKGYVSGKATTIHAFVSGNVTPNDSLLAAYRRQKDDAFNGAANATKTSYGLGYVHSMSKRTSLFADIAREKTTKPTSTTKGTMWDVGIRHNF